MSDSYEIIDDGPCIRIVSPDSTISTIVGRPVGYHIDDAVIGAIRQQARDMDQLRADLAAAVAERDEARTAYQVRSTEWHQHELIALALAERYKLRAEQAEARLAVIDEAPTVAVVSECAAGLYVHQKLFGAQLAEPGAELIYRPAKD